MINIIKGEATIDNIILARTSKQADSNGDGEYQSPRENSLLQVQILLSLCVTYGEITPMIR